jgi:hypothetical protein
LIMPSQGNNEERGNKRFNGRCRGLSSTVERRRKQ